MGKGKAKLLHIRVLEYRPLRMFGKPKALLTFCKEGKGKQNGGPLIESKKGAFIDNRRTEERCVALRLHPDSTRKKGSPPTGEQREWTAAFPSRIEEATLIRSLKKGTKHHLHTITTSDKACLCPEKNSQTIKGL